MEGPEDVEVHLGKTMTLTCRVSGDPIPEVKWMHNSGEVLLDNQRYKTRHDGSLVISHVTEQDVGEYECVAHSKMGSTRSRKARALVTVTPSIRYFLLIFNFSR